ncbi:MAG: hypothetical protein AB7N71_09145 [Phycisphaerae bacterium]
MERAVQVNGKVDFGQLYRFAEQDAHASPGLIAVRALNLESGGLWPFTSQFDVVGIFLGVDRQSRTPAYAFLTGVVQLDRGNIGKDRVEHELTDVRLAVATEMGNQLRWTISPRDDDALNVYEKYRSEPGTGLILYPFPNAADRYRLEHRGEALHCVEERSGAEWTVTVGR